MLWLHLGFPADTRQLQRDNAQLSHSQESAAWICLAENYFGGRMNGKTQ